MSLTLLSIISFVTHLGPGVHPGMAHATDLAARQVQYSNADQDYNMRRYWTPPKLHQASPTQQLEFLNGIQPTIGSSLADPDKARVASELSGLYFQYNLGLQAILRGGDAAALESQYTTWAKDRRLEVLHRLLVLLPLLQARRLPQYWGAYQALAATAEHAVKLSESARQVASETNLKALQLSLWQLRFVEPYRDVRDRISDTLALLQFYETRATQRRAVEGIKKEIKGVVESGVEAPELARRIADLPSDLLTEVEQFRKVLEEDRTRRLANEKTERERVERQARRQKAIEQAIAWRKTEIETGKPNSVAEEQRRTDPELARAVGRWELDYRIEAWVEEIRRAVHDPNRTQREEEFRKKSGISHLEVQYRSAVTLAQELRQQHPQFKIVGKIVDREPHAIQVWGRAIPWDADRTVFGGLFNEANILVLNPEQLQSPLFYRGTHYFVGKREGRNAFGGAVPVWVYGAKPASLDQAQVEVDETRKRLDAIGNLLRQRAQDRCARLSEESPLRYMESPAGRLDFRDVILNACLAESGELSSEEKQRHIRDTPSLLRKLQAERN